MSKTIVFYDKVDNDGRGSRAVFELAHNGEDYCHVRQKTDGGWSYSMRSLNGQAKKIITDNGLDGGGHDNACGFKDDRYLIEPNNE